MNIRILKKIASEVLSECEYEISYDKKTKEYITKITYISEVFNYKKIGLKFRVPKTENKENLIIIYKAALNSVIKSIKNKLIKYGQKELEKLGKTPYGYFVKYIDYKDFEKQIIKASTIIYDENNNPIKSNLIDWYKKYKHLLFNNFKEITMKEIENEFVTQKLGYRDLLPTPELIEDYEQIISEKEVVYNGKS